MSALRIAMLGTGGFAIPTFQRLLSAGRHRVVGLVTQPDRFSGVIRGSTRQSSRSMADVANESGIPIYQPESINTPEGVAQLLDWNLDLLVTAAYGQILKADVLQAARMGGINVHASLLPKYRGAAPIAWAIARGETQTGVTIIRMTTGLDAGEMLAQESIDIHEHETAGELEARLAPIGAQLAATIIDRLALGPVVGMPQDPALVTKAPKLSKELGDIDWTKPADEISRLIRALQPWPTAYTFLHRDAGAPQRIIIIKSEVVDGQFAEPGHTRAAAADRLAIEVATGSGILRVLELQAAGKKRMTAAAFINGRGWREGDRFSRES